MCNKVYEVKIFVLNLNKLSLETQFLVMTFPLSGSEETSSIQKFRVTIQNSTAV